MCHPAKKHGAGCDEKFVCDFRRPLRDGNDFYSPTSHSVAGYLPVSLRDQALHPSSTAPMCFQSCPSWTNLAKKASGKQVECSTFCGYGSFGNALIIFNRQGKTTSLYFIAK